MTDSEFLDYMTSCAADRVLVSGEQVGRLCALYGSPLARPMPAGWWGSIDPALTAWAVGRARAAIAKAEGRAA
jgi:hypothetical protein